MTNPSVTSSGTLRRKNKSGTAIFSLTRKGVELAARLHEDLHGSSCYCNFRHALPGMNSFVKISDELPAAWNRYDSIICIMSCGIVVRTLAPFLKDKTYDPAVVVMDENGRFAVSLLSGHLGGANELARKVAAITGGQAVITTASDLQGKPAIDLIARKAGLRIENPAMLSAIASAILDEQPVWVFDPEGILSGHLPADHTFEILPASISADEAIENLYEIRTRYGHAAKTGGDRKQTENTPGIWVSEFVPSPEIECLLLRPSNLVVGIGCNRGTTSGEITEFIEKVFRKNRLSPLSIRNFTSLDLKADERGLLDAAAAFDRPVYFCTREEIAGITVPNPSDMVARHVGAKSVCEASALWSAGTRELLVPKRKSGNCTLAIARVRLSVVSLGPGYRSFMVQEAVDALLSAEIVLGYKTYLDLVPDLLEGKTVISSGMRKEMERCRTAIDHALSGRFVALVSSGDAGIYGMAGLVLDICRERELAVSEWNEEGKADFYLRIIPGIPAFNAAASLTGAPLMHDFAAVSLSDHLTPWEIIEKRLSAAAEADFVLAIYNPRSNSRPDLLKRAQQIILQHRCVETPAAVIRRAMREGQWKSVTTLGQLPIDKVDMQSLVIVGNSRTYIWKGWMVTPRGYMEKYGAKS